MKTSGTNEVEGNLHDVDYQRFIYGMRLYFRHCLQSKGPLFRTNADVWTTYMKYFSRVNERQYHNCNTCRRFIERYGGLAFVGEDGSLHSAVWSLRQPIPIKYPYLSSDLNVAVEEARITGVFIPDREELGVSETGDWRHYALKVPRERVWRGLGTATQEEARKKEGFQNVMRALGRYRSDVFEKALTLVKHDVVFRGEKIAGPLEWLCKLDKLPKRNRTNLVWKAVASAPEGFLHPCGSVLSSLLDDLQKGIHPNVAARSFANKMNPLQYQRPTTKPSSGNIDVAEKLVKQMGIEESLKRRFAKVDECELLWKPRGVVGAPSEGVFVHLREEKSSYVADGGDITWVKFQRDVLPQAHSIDVFVPSRGAFYAFTTEAVVGSPSIFQWRHPVAWYTYAGGSRCNQFCLRAGLNEVVGVTESPPHWFGERNLNFKKNAIWLIAGARDTEKCGLSLFPECLKSELRGIRKVIEEYSRLGELGDVPLGTHAAGLAVVGSDVVVDSGGGGVKMQYKIDRYE